MARLLNRLNARKVASLDAAGRHADGGGLYLSNLGDSRRRWVFLYRWHGRLREMGLGSPRDVSLARAREAAAQACELVAQGQDPRDARRTVRTAKTFRAVADEFIATMQVQWRNEKHAAQWQITLREYAAGLHPLFVDAIGTEDVMHVLRPIWLDKQETVSRLRGRIERVLDAARAFFVCAESVWWGSRGAVGLIH